MDSQRWSQVDALFHRLRQRPKNAWHSMLERECGDDAELRREVLSLLELDESQGGFLEGSCLQDGLALLRQDSHSSERRLTLAPGQRLGRYEITRPIASGGSAEVFEAQQDAPARTVALKVLSPSLGQYGAWRRFEGEARILAKLQDAAIARIYDVGLHELSDGAVPYIVMEYVEGARTLTRFAVEEGLDLRQRLELFREVCRAVGYGHQRGVIHRDLKPSNLLVDTDGRPKIIDFGVARMKEDHDGTRDQTSRTELVGTLQYMSPEQCGNEPELVDTRTDVYSLGVVLYELLTGELPYSVRGLPIPQALRLIQEGDVTRPSTYRPGLRGDLETILLTALSKDPERRYASVAKLQEDIDRFLRHEPILARAPSTLYRLRKLVRRHRVSTALSCALVLAVLGGFIGISTALVEARNQRDAVIELNATATAILEFLESMIASPHDDFDGQEVSMSDWLDRAARRLGSTFEERPEIEWKLRLILGRSYEALGFYPAATEQFEIALERSRSLYGTDDLRIAEIRVDLGGSYHDLFRLHESLALLERALEAQKRRLGTDHLTTLRTRNYLGLVLLDLGRLEESERELGAVLTGRRAALEPEHDDVLQSHFNLAIVQAERGKHDAAEALLRDALEIALQQPDPNARRLSGLKLRLGTILAARGQMDEAEQMIREGAETYQAAYSADHPNVAATHYHIGWLHLNRGDAGRAEQQLEKATDIFRRQFGPEHRWTIRTSVLLAAAYRLQDRHEEAIETLSGLVATVRAAGLGLADLVDPLLGLARAHYYAGHGDESWRLGAELLELIDGERVAPGIWLSLGNLRAMITLDRGEPEEALKIIRATLDRPMDSSYDSASMITDLQVTRADCLRAEGRLDEARELAVEAYIALADSPPWLRERATQSLEKLVIAFRDRGQADHAKAVAKVLDAQ